MRDYLNIGSTPADEECEQVGPNCDYTKMRSECQRFIEAIRSTLGPEPPKARLAIKGFEHDFGTYYEVVCYFDDENEESQEYAFKCESESPVKWPEGV